MLGWLKRDPKKKLEAEYARRLQEARDLQRKGDIKGYAAVSAEADNLSRQLDALKNNP
jgi:hypothetical protein